MKKALLAGLLLVAVFTTVGCGTKEEETKTEPYYKTVTNRTINSLNNLTDEICAYLESPEYQEDLEREKMSDEYWEEFMYNSMKNEL